MRCEAPKTEVFVSNLVDTSFPRRVRIEEGWGESGGNLYYQTGAQPYNQETVWAT